MTALSLATIEKSYGSRQVLRAVSAELQPGRIAALVGRNGAGKTTMLRIAARLQWPDAGTVSGPRALFFGGGETLPVRATVNALRAALTLEPDSEWGKRRLSTLSKGELQQIGLRIAFETPSDALLLDEPWTGLEPDARMELNDTLRREADGGRIVVCSTHDLDQAARVADDFILLRDGQLFWRRREDMSSDVRHDELLAFFRDRRGAA